MSPTTPYRAPGSFAVDTKRLPIVVRLSLVAATVLAHVPAWHYVRYKDQRLCLGGPDSDPYCFRWNQGDQTESTPDWMLCGMGMPLLLGIVLSIVVANIAYRQRIKPSLKAIHLSALVFAVITYVLFARFIPALQRETPLSSSDRKPLAAGFGFIVYWLVVTSALTILLLRVPIAPRPSVEASDNSRGERQDS